MPLLDEQVRMIYIRWLAVDGQDAAMIRLLINRARNIAYERDYSFASIGLHEKDPLGKCFRGMFKWISWLTLFAMHGFLWSSQNYVNHAFSPRDIINGAHNLKMPLWLKPVYLNFNLHLAHHQNPNVPWLHLPKFIRSGKGRISFFKNYLRLWKGPRLTEEASPRSAEDD